MSRPELLYFSEQDDVEVPVPSAIVWLRHHKEFLSGNAWKVLITLMSYSWSWMDGGMPADSIFSVSCKDFKERAFGSTRSDNRNIKFALEELRKYFVIPAEDSSDGRSISNRAINIVNQFSMPVRSRIFQWQFSEDFLNLCRSPGVWSRVKMKDLQKMKKASDIRLYLLVSMRQGMNWPGIRVERDMAYEIFGEADYNRTWRELNRCVASVGIKKISKLLDVSISILTNSDLNPGKEMHHIDFQIQVGNETNLK